MKISEFDFNLPEELIAQTPLDKRDTSRLMVLNRNQQTIEHKQDRKSTRLNSSHGYRSRMPSSA